MKQFNQYYLSSMFILLLSVFLFSCDAVSGDDPCDDTVASEKIANIAALVYVLEENGDPIVNQQVDFTMYKKPCGADRKGVIDFSGTTDAEGIVSSSYIVNYNLRNTDDRVYAEAHAVNLGNGSVEADSRSSSLSYVSFTSGHTSTISLYIYREP